MVIVRSLGMVTTMLIINIIYVFQIPHLPKAACSSCYKLPESDNEKSVKIAVLARRYACQRTSAC